MKFFCITLGCKVNQYETEAITEKLCDSGLQHVEEIQKADVIIINSCSVTATSDGKVRKSVNKAKRENPSAIIVLTGCMVQAFPDKSKEIPGVDIICGNVNKMLTTEYLSTFQKGNSSIVDVPSFQKETPFEKMSINKFDGRTRAFVKIEDGCNRFCSYCIIPYARGRVRSKSIDDLKAEIQSLANNKYKEIVLVGINLSCYGQDTGYTLCDAVETVCSVPGIEQVRLGSLEPECLTPNVIKRLSMQKKLCNHFHLSLQSGAANTLQNMNRYYTKDEFEQIVNNIRETFPNVAITTDIMVGFPGETSLDFEESLEFVKKIKFSQVHVFAYSRRSGTKADLMPNQVAEYEKKLRSKKMCDLAQQLHKSFLQEQIGKIEQVLFEREISPNLYEGHTSNYTTVHMISNNNLHNKIASVTLTPQNVLLENPH